MIRQLAPGMVQQMQSVCTDCNGEGNILLAEMLSFFFFLEDEMKISHGMCCVRTKVR